MPVLYLGRFVVDPEDPTLSSCMAPGGDAIGMFDRRVPASGSESAGLQPRQSHCRDLVSAVIIMMPDEPCVSCFWESASSQE